MRRIAKAATALLIVLTACNAATPIRPTTGGGGQLGGDGFGGAGLSGGHSVSLGKGALVRFQACGDFLSYVQAQALDLVGPYGLDFYGHRGWPVVDTFLEGAARVTFAPSTTAVAATTTVPATRAGDEEFSGTNNQERGVDEPDLVKTDGERIISLVDSRLTVIDVTGDEPRLVGSIQLDPQTGVQDMFLHEDRVILLGNTWGFPTPLGGEGISSEAIVAPEYQGSPQVTLIEIDIATTPRFGRTLRLDGTHLSSRLIDGTARVVITSGPTGFAWSYPEGSGLRAERNAIEDNKSLIEKSTLKNWVPYYVLSDSNGDVISEGTAIDCDQAHHPETFAGLNMLSVISIDMDEGLEILDSTGVLASGETVYSSTDAMYIATTKWIDWRRFESGELDAEVIVDEARTQIHQFDISGDASTYTASGSVKGYLLNQFSMSEHNGDLRVATTTAPDWWGGRGAQQESGVSVLRPDGAELEVIGSVGGLGKGEQIYSVRFMGDVAYVVTFRQVDPLYTIDISDPTKPVVRGELKIPGYSSYLHPLSDDLVIGVGQHATDTGRLRGSQVALFDVSDLDDPRRIAKVRFGRGTNSMAEHDHRAFMHWGNTIVVPLTEYNWKKDDGYFTGAVGIRVGAESLTEVARIAHPGAENWETGWDSTILRSLVIDGSLYTVSTQGVMKSDLDSFGELAWLGF